MQPTPIPPITCTIPEWIGDGFCDDENNNAQCQFDLGDCCNNKNPGWDQFCTVCECLQSNTTSISPTSPTTPVAPTTPTPIECGGQLSGPSGDFSSPGWPNNYTKHQECTWEITCEKQQIIEINFNSFSLEYNDQCRYSKTKFISFATIS